MKKKAIIVDLDGTLADITHRRHFLEGEKKDWKNFSRNVIRDELNVWCREIILRMAPDHEILLVSGRGEELREETESWLTQHSVPYQALYMRRRGDHRDDTVVKREIFEEKIRPEHEVLFAIDDRAKVVRMWREAGVVCLQCDWGDF